MTAAPDAKGRRPRLRVLGLWGLDLGGGKSRRDVPGWASAERLSLHRGSALAPSSSARDLTSV